MHYSIIFCSLRTTSPSMRHLSIPSTGNSTYLKGNGSKKGNYWHSDIIYNSSDFFRPYHIDIILVHAGCERQGLDIFLFFFLGKIFSTQCHMRVNFWQGYKYFCTGEHISLTLVEKIFKMSLNCENVHFSWENITTEIFAMRVGGWRCLDGCRWTIMNIK